MKWCYVAMIKRSRDVCNSNFPEIILISFVAQKCYLEIAVDDEISSY